MDSDNHNLTSFHWVCLEGYEDIAKIFLDKANEGYKIDFNIQDFVFEWTPFHFACYEGNAAVVDLILENSETLKVIFIFGFLQRICL